MSFFSLSTWRNLGLTAGALLIGLGLAVAVEPYQLSQSLGITPAANNAADPTIRMIKLLGARDLAIGLTLASLLYNNKHKEAGTLLLSFMVVCVADIWSLAAESGVVACVPFTVMSLVLGEVGWALYKA